MSTCAVLFLKNPEPGRVKTRLHDCCSPEEAAELYRAFILDSAAVLSGCRANMKFIAYDPPTAEQPIRELLGADDLAFISQPSGDLGTRMEGALYRCAEAGAERAVIIGSDSPSLPVEYLDQAFDQLETRQVVLGPSTDGGYYLLGVQLAGLAKLHRLFSGIDWSSGNVLEQTLSRLDGHADPHTETSMALLPPWYDVDTPADAAFLKVHLRALLRSGADRGDNSLPVLEKMTLPPPS
jgi:rSAM/selenodomain-associated transferase 1